MLFCANSDRAFDLSEARDIGDGFTMLKNLSEIIVAETPGNESERGHEITPLRDAQLSETIVREAPGCFGRAECFGKGSFGEEVLESIPQKL